ncbi:histidine phosphatase family protein [Sphingomonas endolithica]|uniref:histidine phosphatase family protein n=1 Tax=Sphingomonas endolithica TaxID=2972485 RepID=UPI0021AF1940|nr:histidine phosphatase family protein [Sphingomonas sp. ZFBP2030]
MTGIIVLIRHAAHADLGQILSGRTPGIPLSDDGRRQAAALAEHMAGQDLAAVHTSPVQRARETADAIRSVRDVPCVTVDALQEIDFGAWTGRSFAELDGRPDWTDWNRDRGSARAADGETMAEAQARIVHHIEQVARDHAGETVAMVSHCDLIRAAIAHYLGLPLACLLNFDVDPASFSRLAVGDWGGRVLSINETAS